MSWFQQMRGPRPASSGHEETGQLRVKRGYGECGVGKSDVEPDRLSHSQRLGS
jgi:hypothetical protein